MSGTLAWLGVQAHVMASVLGAVISNQSAPARQVVIYVAALAVLLSVLPKIAKKVSK